VYKNQGITGMTNRSRKDKGHVRKATPEELLEALSAAKPHFHNQRTNKRALYVSSGRQVGHFGGQKWAGPPPVNRGQEWAGPSSTACR
jgi:hypothetical protein